MSCCKSELRHTYTNQNGSKHANIIHVTEICSSIHPPTHPPKRQPTHPPIHPSIIHPSIHPAILCRNILVPKRLGTETSRVFRGLVLNRLDAETSGAPGLGPKSLVTKTTWCHFRARSHFRLVVSAYSPDGRSIWPNTTSRFCPASFRPRVILVSFSRDMVE